MSDSENVCVLSPLSQAFAGKKLYGQFMEISPSLNKNCSATTVCFHVNLGNYEEFPSGILAVTLIAKIVKCARNSTFRSLFKRRASSSGRGELIT
jgi:hypothetical protein